MSDSPVTIYRSDKCYDGYTLFCHTYEDACTGWDGVAHMVLVDMAGKSVHEWTAQTAVQLLDLLPDGSLYYSTRDRSNLDQAGLYRIAPDSSMLWRYHCRVDHDFHVMDDGHLMIHCLIDRMVPRLGPELRRNSYIIEVDADTKELLWEWHGEDHVQELIDLCGLEVPIDWPERIRREVEEIQAWDERLRDLPPEELVTHTQRLIDGRAFDWAHNNTCEVIPDNLSGAKDARFRAGNIIFSYRSLDIIGVIDRESGEIVWAWGPRELDGQHQPTMLPNGHIMVYDNGTRRGYSRVIELDPLSGEIVWEYTGTPKRSFFAAFISGAQLLSNGNVLICEGAARVDWINQEVKTHLSNGNDLVREGAAGGNTWSSRLFEVTRDKEIVWEYKSPYTDAGTYGIYRATRYAPEFVEPLLKGVQV